jgi:hypothetical protein
VLLQTQNTCDLKPGLAKQMLADHAIHPDTLMGFEGFKAPAARGLLGDKEMLEVVCVFAWVPQELVSIPDHKGQISGPLKASGVALPIEALLLHLQGQLDFLAEIALWAFSDYCQVHTRRTCNPSGPVSGQDASKSAHKQEEEDIHYKTKPEALIGRNAP